MSFKPINIDSLFVKIREGESRLRGDLANLWELIVVYPAHWQHRTSPVLASKFWVVAIFGEYVIWYNDIEEGFNISRYNEHGTIGEYWANQDDLDECVRRVHGMIYWGGKPRRPS